MASVLEKTAECLAEYKGKTVAVAVSGGRDSVCLLHAVLNCGIFDMSSVVAVHVNHNLRENAARDEVFVRELCKKLNIKLHVYGVDAKREAENNGLTVEQAARNLRYGIFGELIKRGVADVVLTAHHALDNAESVLMHMFRGSGLDGLCGIKSGKFARPFLDVYPDELDSYINEYGLTFVTDETNFDDEADRNFLRLNVIPLIEKRYRGAVKNINALSRECDGICRFIDGALDDSLVYKDGGAVVIRDGAFSDVTLAARYIRRAMTYFALTDMTRAMTERVIALYGMQTGKTAELPFGVIAAREYDGVAIYIPRERFDGEIEIKVGANYIDGLTVDITPCDNKSEAQRGTLVDLDKINGATLRFRRDGDMFTPFGGGTKKLKQYFTDKKIPARIKDRIPLLCKGNTVLCVVGVEIADSVKVTDKTAHAATVARRF